MTKDQLNAILADHALWLRGAGGKRADLSGADLSEADLSGANLRGANLRGADLSEANLSGANLRLAYLRLAYLSGANLREATLREANLSEATLREANLSGANLSGANLLCQGNMLELRTMQFDRWAIGYTADTLQIGCQRHAIDKWRRWDTEAGRKWIAQMDCAALAWAERNLQLVLAIIEANPATPTGHEEKENDR